jgi:hypothetical protein
VLNGPDKQILEQIIGNPLSITTAPISTEALIKQVDEMSGIIERQNANLAKVYKQPKIEIPKQQEILRIRNPTTGEERISTDGGNNWQPARR